MSSANFQKNKFSEGKNDFLNVLKPINFSGLQLSTPIGNRWILNRALRSFTPNVDNNFLSPPRPKKGSNAHSRQLKESGSVK